MKKGRLFLIPSPLGDPSDMGRLFPEYNLEIIRGLDCFLSENIRTARRFVSSVGHPRPIDQLQFSDIGKHSDPGQFRSLMDPLFEGRDMGMLSEAGTPCVADPGSEVVAIAQQHGIDVFPLIGPNAILLALMASGFNGQNFTFHGYLPVGKEELVRDIRKLEHDAKKNDQTQIFIETPFRNRKLFDLLLKVLQPSTMLCVAVDITLPGESIRSRTVESWRKDIPDLHKKPAVFLLYS